MIIAGMILGITGAAYAQSGAGGAGGAVGAAAAVGGSAGVSSGAAAGQAGSEMSGMSKALPHLEQESPMRRDAPGLGGTAEPQVGAAAGPRIPPGKQRESKAMGGESTGRGKGSPPEQGASGKPSAPVMRY